MIYYKCIPYARHIAKASNVSERDDDMASMKKQRFIIAVVIVIIICIAALAGCIGDQGREATVDDRPAEVNEIGSDLQNPDTAPVLQEGDGDRLAQCFELIYAEVEGGYPDDYVKEKYNEEYDYILKQGFEAFECLKQQCVAANATVRRIATAEWLMSEIIKLQAGEELAYYRQENGTTATRHACAGLTGPGESFEKWRELKKGEIIEITGMLNTDWYTARKVVPSEPATNNTYKANEYDWVEFWIHRDDFYFIHEDKPIQFGSCRVADAEQYTYMVKSDISKQYNPVPGEVECIQVYTAPDEGSGVVGYAYMNDLIRLKKDQLDPSGFIKEGEWLLIEKVMFYEDNSDVGWVREEHITEIADGMQPRQGFILRNTKIYSQPDTYSVALNDTHRDVGEALAHNPVSCIHITGKMGGWFEVSAGVNSFTGYIREEDVYFTITEKDIMQ